jgi:signal transduction histidine kinase
MRVASQRKTKALPNLELAVDEQETLQLVGLALPGLILQSVVHEINNPLSVVGGNLIVLEVLLEEVKELLTAETRAADEPAQSSARLHDLSKILTVLQEAHEGLEDAVQGADKAGKLLGHLRDLAPVHSEESIPCQMSNLIDKALELLGGAFKYEIEIFKELKPVAMVRGKYGDLLRLLVCLLARTRRASEESGRVWIRSWMDGQTVVISIEDTKRTHAERGSESCVKGRSPTAAELLLDKSLDFAEMLTRDLGGQIEVVATSTRGTRVFLRLPAAH